MCTSCPAGARMACAGSSGLAPRTGTMRMRTRLPTRCAGPWSAVRIDTPWKATAPRRRSRRPGQRPKRRTMAVEQALQGFKETESGESFSLQNPRLLKVELADVTIQAKLGAMVAYQGEVKFERAATGGMARLMKKVATGRGSRPHEGLGHRRGVPRLPCAGGAPGEARRRQDHGQQQQPARFRGRHRLGHPQGRGRLRRAGRRPVQPRACRYRVGGPALRRPADAARARRATRRSPTPRPPSRGPAGCRPR